MERDTSQTGDRGVSLGIEIFGHDNSENGGQGTYTTLVYFPLNPGANSAFDGGDARWRTTQPIGALTPSPTGQYTWDEIEAGLGGVYDTATTIAVHLQIGSSDATTPSNGTVSAASSLSPPRRSLEPVWVIDFTEGAGGA